MNIDNMIKLIVTLIPFVAGIYMIFFSGSVIDKQEKNYFLKKSSTLSKGVNDLMVDQKTAKLRIILLGFGFILIGMLMFFKW